MDELNKQWDDFNKWLVKLQTSKPVFVGLYATDPPVGGPSRKIEDVVARYVEETNSLEFRDQLIKRWKEGEGLEVHGINEDKWKVPTKLPCQ